MVESNKPISLIVGIIILLLIGFLIFYYNASNLRQPIQTRPSVQSIKPAKWVISTKIVDKDILCNISMYYNPDAFKNIIANWTSFKDYLVKNISKFREPGTGIKDINIKYSIDSSSIQISFKVYGAVSESNGECTATFLWLLNPLGLDFIDNHFNEYNDRLTWSGVINGVEYSITILLPMQNTPYKAWGSEVGHCHGHVWWPCKG